MSIPADRLVAEALSKSGLLWVSSSAGSAPCWHVGLDGVAYLVSGPGEQDVPAHDGLAKVIVRAKESRARLATFAAQASRVQPSDEDWENATQALRAARLNAPASDLVARWREECRVTRLVPDLTTVVVRGELLPPPSIDATPSEPDSSIPRPPVDRPGRPARSSRPNDPARPANSARPSKREAERTPDDPTDAAASAERAAAEEHARALRAERAQPGHPTPDSRPGRPPRDESGDDDGAATVAP